MPKYVWIGNGDQKTRIDLAPLAYKEGGQGTVYLSGLFPIEMINTCIKVINKPEDFAVQMEAITKMLEHPAQPYERAKHAAAVPLELVWDENKKAIGYTMEELRSWHGFHELTTVEGSESTEVDLRAAGLLLAALSRAIRTIHGQGFVIGDLNPSNVLFKHIPLRYFDPPDASIEHSTVEFQVRVIDVDSWSIHRPDLGIEYSSHVLDRGVIYHPDIIQADKEGKPWPHFTPDHDWWAFACICWWVLTKHDPYQWGKHEAIKNKEKRILKNLTANSAVAVRLGFISGSAVQALGPKLRFYLDRCLKGKEKRPFPTKMLEDFADNLRTCACGFTAHASAVICPKCAQLL